MQVKGLRLEGQFDNLESHATLFAVGGSTVL